MFQSPVTIPSDTYVELVQTVFRSRATTAIIALSYMAVAALVVAGTPDPLLIAWSVLGAVAMAARVAVLALLRKTALSLTLAVGTARKIERMFGASYLCFATVFGMFSARAFVVATPEAHVLIVALLVGYAAGVAAAISLRPWIGVSAMLLAVVPTVLIAFTRGSHIYWGVGALLAVFLLGGIHSMVSRFKFATEGMTRMRVFAGMARTDVLTGVANRLALQECFEALVDRGHKGPDLAVHYLDLDRFKPVNDNYGHPVGDALLRLVAERLSQLLRSSDFVARVGGDEFVILQRIHDAAEAEVLRGRIIQIASEPYIIGDRAISIGVSVGTSISSTIGADFEKLIESADDALLRAKMAGDGRSQTAHGVVVDFRRAS